MVASQSHLVLAQVAKPMGSMMIRVRLTNHDRQTVSEAYSFTRTGAMLGAQQLQSGRGRAGGAGRAEHQREPVTAVHLAYAWSFWIKFTYSVISLCPVSSADKMLHLPKFTAVGMLGFVRRVRRQGTDA